MIRRFDSGTENETVFAGKEKIVFTLDVAGNITFLNDAGERLIGYSCEEARRMNALEILPKKCAENFRAQATRNIRELFRTVFEIEITTKDRRRARLEMSMDLVRRGDGAIEFHGVAVPQSENLISVTNIQRCLHESFAFGTLTRADLFAGLG